MSNNIQNTIVDNPSFIWIRVNISEGMFSSEKAVTIKLSNGNDVSIFADRGLLKKDSDGWKLKVTQIKTNSGTQIVLLPIEPFEVPTRWVEVPL